MRRAVRIANARDGGLRWRVPIAAGIWLAFALPIVAAVFVVRWMASARGFSPKDFALALGALTLGISLHLASQWYLV